jgi:hypothetical protein
LPQRLEFVFRDNGMTITDTRVRLLAGAIAVAQPAGTGISRRGASRRQKP